MVVPLAVHVGTCRRDVEARLMKKYKQREKGREYYGSRLLPPQLK